MSADVPIWVEVKVTKLRWVKVHAATLEQAVELAGYRHRTTGVATYEEPKEADNG